MLLILLRVNLAQVTPTPTVTPSPPPTGAPISEIPLLQALLGGLVGALLVFALTQLVLVIRERRDFRAAVIVVLDEMEGNMLECQIGKSPHQIEKAGLKLTVADVMRTDRFDSVELILARRLPVTLRTNVSRACRDAKGPSAHVNVKLPQARAVFAVLEETLNQAASELKSYAGNLEKPTAWLQPSKRIPYEAAPSRVEVVDWPTQHD